MRGVTNALRGIVNELYASNQELSKQVDELTLQVFCLREAEERLKDITKDQNVSLKSLVGLIEENKRITQEKQKLMREDTIAALMDVIFKADSDESGDIGKKEYLRMLQYMRGLPQIQVNEKRLKKFVKQNRTVHSLLEIANDIARDDIPDRQRIFKFVAPTIEEDEEDAKPKSRAGVVEQATGEETKPPESTPKAKKKSAEDKPSKLKKQSSKRKAPKRKISKKNSDLLFKPVKDIDLDESEKS